MIVANILDPIHHSLDPKVFGPDWSPRPSVVKFIQKVFKTHVEKQFKNLTDDDFSLYISGSLTTMQFSDDSDCDISVFPHYDDIEARTGRDPEELRKELITFTIDKMDGTFIPGTQHPLQFYMVDYGIRPSDLFQPGLRSAWSFDDKAWVVPPEPARAHNVSIELPLMFLHAATVAQKMATAIEQDPEKAKRMFKRIHQKRHDDQVKGYGDFSQSNIIYKHLLNQGLFAKLQNLGVHISKIADTLDSPIQVIYSFDDDSIILGVTGAETPHRSTMIGEYDGENIVLSRDSRQWFNPLYFKKLWSASFPTRPIQKVIYEHDGEHLSK